MNIGRRFKLYRERAKLTQKEAAEALGIKSYQLANYESNRSEPNIKTLKGMSKLYHVSIDFMVGNGHFFETETFKESEEQEVNFDEFKKKIETLLKEFGNRKE